MSAPDPVKPSAAAPLLRLLPSLRNHPVDAWVVSRGSTGANSTRLAPGVQTASVEEFLRL